MAKSITGLSTSFKALKINQDVKRFGSFAEIGAGQEVARHFFKAGQASGTIAKSMSAYDMIFSDEIYGKEESGRYVCESRLSKMLDHEFELLDSRLKDSRGKESLFFSFANTVATNRNHGWVGVRFQLEPNGAPHDLILHVKTLDNTRLQQAEALGILGVNLMYGAFFHHEDPNFLIQSLSDNLSSGRVEIDLVKFKGPKFENIDNRLMCLELVKNNLTQDVVFNSKGEVSQLAEECFSKAVFLLRGEFRPITNTNIEILNKGLSQFKSDHNLSDEETLPLLEITMAHLKNEDKDNIDKKDFLDRVDVLAALGFRVMISNHNFFYEVKKSLRENTQKPIGMVIGGNHLDYFFNAVNYDHLDGKIFEASSKLFDKNVTVYIFPYKTSASCITLKSYMPDAKTAKLLSFLEESGNISELADCDDIEASTLSSEVRNMLLKGDDSWKSLVPKKVKELIEEKKLFIKI